MILYPLTLLLSLSYRPVTSQKISRPIPTCDQLWYLNELFSQWNYTDPYCDEELVRGSTLLHRESFFSRTMVDSYNQAFPSLSQPNYLPLAKLNANQFEVRALYTRSGLQLCFQQQPRLGERICILESSLSSTIPSYARKSIYTDYEIVLIDLTWPTTFNANVDKKKKDLDPGYQVEYITI